MTGAPYIGVYNLAAIEDTAWHAVRSEDCQDLAALPGVLLPAGLRAGLVVFDVETADTSLYFWPRAVPAAAPTTAAIRLDGAGQWSRQVRQLRRRLDDGGRDGTVGPQVISVAKSHAGLVGRLEVHFWPAR